MGHKQPAVAVSRILKPVVFVFWSVSEGNYVLWLITSIARDCKLQLGILGLLKKALNSLMFQNVNVIHITST